VLFLCSLLHFVSLAPAGDRLGRTYVQFPAFVTSGTLEKRGARSIKPRRSGTTLKWTAATNASLRPSRRRPEYRHLVIVGFDERNVRSRCEETRCLLAEICHRMNRTAPGTRRNAVSPGQYGQRQRLQDRNDIGASRATSSWREVAESKRQ